MSLTWTFGVAIVFRLVTLKLNQINSNFNLNELNIRLIKAIICANCVLYISMQAI